VSPDASASPARHVPRGVRADRETLLGLRRYGAVMRRLLAIDAERREGPRPLAARGQGMDYAESRPYSPGDDVRRIDWRVTARTGRAHTKLYQLERGNDLYCIVDQRAAMRFGTRRAFKSVVAAEIAALTAWAAAAGGDRFGALVAGGSERAIRTGAADDSAPALCDALVREAPDSGLRAGETPIDALARRAASEAPRGSRFVVATDFADPDAAVVDAVQTLRSRGEVFLVWVFDAMEAWLPPPARYPLTDGREHLTLDTAAADVREAHARGVAARCGRLARFAAQPGTRCHAVRTGAELFAALAQPFGQPALDPTQ